MICRKCGAQLVEGATVCSACGTPVVDENNNAPAIQAAPVPEESKYKGLGGWLVLVILGIIINAGFLGYTIYTDVDLYRDGTVTQLSDPNFINYIAGYSMLINFELAASALLIVTAIYLVYLFFKTKKEFPKYYIFFLSALLIFATIEFVFMQGMSAHIKSLVQDVIDKQRSSFGQAILGALIWISYMNKSKRVKATFIN